MRRDRVIFIGGLLCALAAIVLFFLANRLPMFSASTPLTPINQAQLAQQVPTHPTKSSVLAPTRTIPGTTPISSQPVPSDNNPTPGQPGTTPTQPAQPTAIPTPTPAPTYHTCTASSCPNPWGYVLGCSCGNMWQPVAIAPAGFCSWFQCTLNFDAGSGDILECGDGMFDHASDNCAGHDGGLGYLYQYVPATPTP
ncbi:MAG TPA: hypothetical protein VFN23_18505 [Ktedonobacteraceae bacterium]|nr:hypothetical protein [Ktedonobacteraceae bacterium]